MLVRKKTRVIREKINKIVSGIKKAEELYLISSSKDSRISDTRGNAVHMSKIKSASSINSIVRVQANEELDKAAEMIKELSSLDLKNIFDKSYPQYDPTSTKVEDTDSCECGDDDDCDLC